MLSLDFTSVKFIHLMRMPSSTQDEGSDLSDTETLPNKQGNDCPGDADQIDITAQNDSPITTHFYFNTCLESPTPQT